MFDLYSYWSLGCLIGIIGIVSIIGSYKTKNLPPKQKELSQLFYAFAIFGVLTIFLIFGLPLFYDFTFVPEKINTLDEAQKILAKQNESLEELRDKLDRFRYVVYMFLLFFVTSILPSIYNFAKAITPIDNKNILNLDVEDDKPIFGLNNE